MWLVVHVSEHEPGLKMHFVLLQALLVVSAPHFKLVKHTRHLLRRA